MQYSIPHTRFPAFFLASMPYIFQGIVRHWLFAKGKDNYFATDFQDNKTISQITFCVVYGTIPRYEK